MNWKFFGVLSLAVNLLAIPLAIRMELPLWGIPVLIVIIEICILIACIETR